MWKITACGLKTASSRSFWDFIFMTDLLNEEKLWEYSQEKLLRKLKKIFVYREKYIERYIEN